MNEPDPPNRDLEIFTAALSLPMADRAAYLERAGGNDPALRQRVEALLDAHEQAGDFMARAPVENEDALGAKASLLEKPGDRIGRYKLLQQIGEGGCGVVYLAEQEEPVRRRVALKIIKAGMDTKSVIARFEAERQALALMDHPSIAKVLDAGATESGRPYFVMELVRGVKISDYCDEHSLTTEERLNLFVQVCQAVQHAHQKGIIHRDLKPSNILVTQTAEGVALPVVIDFGIAKATTSQRLTDKTIFTAFEMLVGTPAYMSPEQAVLTSVDVDTRTDIYSLGVLLYELLTSTTPFDAGELMKAGVDEVRRVIREREPVRPSSRLSRMTKDDLTNVAQHRGAEPPKLIRAVHGDLDWIVMKALEKDRTRRYETANGLALDIKRYLADETVSARPPSALYRFQKTVHRHKVLFGGLAVVTALLVASLIVIAASLTKERQARQEADAARRQAEADKIKATTEAAKSQQVTRFLEEMLQGVGPSVAQGRDTKMLREILDRTVARLGIEMAEQPATEAEIRSLLGRLYLEIANYAEAEKMHRIALAINQRIFGPESAEAAATWNELGLVFWKASNLPETERAHQEALRIRRGLYGEEHPDVATSLNNLAGVYRKELRLAQAETMVREALRIRRKFLGRDNLDVADSLNHLSIVLCDQGKYVDGEAAARESLELRRKLLGAEHPLVAASVLNLAWVVGWTERYSEAEALTREALAMQRKLFGDAHPATLQSLRNLGLILKFEGNWPAAEAAHREAFALWGKRTGEDGAEAFAELESLCGVLISEKKVDEARHLIDEAATRAAGRQPASARVLWLRAELAARQGDWPEAAADAESALESSPDDRARFHTLAPLLAITGKHAAYEMLCKRIIGAFGETTNTYLAQRAVLDCLLLPQPGFDLRAGDKLIDPVLRVGTGRLLLQQFQLFKAVSDCRQGRFGDAIGLARSALESRQAFVQVPAHAVLAMALYQSNEIDEARAELEKGAALFKARLSDQNGADLGDDWKEWIFARLLVDEAAAVIRPSALLAGKANAR